MKYYSEKTHKLYDTADAIADAERVFDEKEEQRKAKEEEAKRVREAAEQERDEAWDAVETARKEFARLSKAYDEKYGHKATIDSFYSLLEYLDKVLGD